MINIIEAKETEVCEIRQLLLKVWRDTFSGILEDHLVSEIPLEAYEYKLLESQIQNADIKFLVARNDDGMIVGVINAKHEKQTLYIHRLYVDRSFQRQGIGVRLIEEMTHRFPNARKIILEVIDKNVNGIEFYLKNGFSIVGKNNNIINDNILDVLVLEKEIMI